MTDEQRSSLRQDARNIFYHGHTNYLKYAFPEDELRPLACSPLTRDRQNPAHIEVNDVLGNYSLTLIDGLSTLAILASRPTSEHDGHNALHDFQQDVAMLVYEYGDGSQGPAGQGRRARGFDLDSKVQLFETTIRGLGGLLSAHLFAVGDLPIRGYEPEVRTQPSGKRGILWSAESGRGGKFVYDGQLLRLAHDMGKRLLPAFHTPTGIPYPRVNLRYGIPFYDNSPFNNDAEHGKCDATDISRSDMDPSKSGSDSSRGEREVTETCSAGAGSLVLEFTVLSRLTGDMQFERIAKRAFFAVWERRTKTGLIGAGIDAETGQWISPYTGIGAGIDSFFEYALKSHILLSGAGTTNTAEDEPSSTAFLNVWDDAHAAIKRHVYRGANVQHPHYAQNDMYSGGPRLAWIDSLSAYYPGLLVLAGEIEEATATHLLYTALWTRYGALPERWNTFTGRIDSGLRWWGGRPEFIESAWYLYRATQDPWYLHVGEMVMRDIYRRCWTPCGWAGLQDVRTGEQSDRMESFFLGETAKYLYLLFDDNHPLNHLDAPFVFTTEGHPLIIPKKVRKSGTTKWADVVDSADQCPIPPILPPLSGSAVASRRDVFHAAFLARLHESTSAEIETYPLVEGSTEPSLHTQLVANSTTGRMFYPWTLPRSLLPADGICDNLPGQQTFDLTFPVLPNVVSDLAALQRIENGILIKSISGLRLSLILENDEARPGQQIYRVYALSSLTMGRDESIYMGPDVISHLSPVDPYLSRNKDIEAADLIMDVPTDRPQSTKLESVDVAIKSAVKTFNDRVMDFFASSGQILGPLSTQQSPGELLMKMLPEGILSDGARLADHFEQLADHSEGKFDMPRALRDAAAELRSSLQWEAAEPTVRPQAGTGATTGAPIQLQRLSIPVLLPSGPGAAPLPALAEFNPDPLALPLGHLTFRRILVLDTDLCADALPSHVAHNYNVIVIRRGGCSFTDKLQSIPSFPPSERALKLVITVSFPEHEDERKEQSKGTRRRGAAQDTSQGMSAHDFYVRPHLHEQQLTPVGTERRNPLPLVMVGGGAETWHTLEASAGIRGTFVDGELRMQRREAGSDWLDFAFQSGSEEDSIEWNNGGGGLSIKRRVWFASNGIRIGNLHLA